MKHMIMVFGDAATMTATKSPEWIKEMIAFMRALDDDLRASGELLYDEGLADGSTAKTVGLEDGVPVASDGPVAKDKSLIGFWVLDAEDEARAIAVASRIVEVIGAPVEVRRIPERPPEV
jgi:hypothetical protein